jgi:hypothetical protein
MLCLLFRKLSNDGLSVQIKIFESFRHPEKGVPPYILLCVNAHTAWATIKSIYLLPNSRAAHLQVNDLYALTRQEKMLLAILSELVNIRTLLESSNNMMATEAEWDIYQKLRKEALDGYEQTLH